MERKYGQMVQKIKTKLPECKTPEERMALYKSLSLWNVIEKELEELIDNQDIEITTVQDLVVVSLVKAVIKGIDTDC